MPKRPCLGCKRLIPTADGNRCQTCRSVRDRQRDARRGGTTQRGYGRVYQRERERVLPRATHCCVCGVSFAELGVQPTAEHLVSRRHGGRAVGNLGAACARCNYGWARHGNSK